MAILYGWAGIAAAACMPGIQLHTDAFYPALLFTTTVFAILVFLMVRLYRSKRTADYRELLQVLMTGISVSLFPFVVLYALPIMLIHDQIMEWQWTTLFLTLMPLTLFYMVISERFVDIAYFLRRLLSCGLIGMCSAVAVVIAFRSLTRGGAGYEQIDMIRLGLVVLLGVSIMLYIKEYMDYYLRKRLYPKGQDFQISLNRFLQWLKTDYDLHDLGRVLKREIEACLPFEGVKLASFGTGAWEERSDGKPAHPTSSPTNPDVTINLNKSGFSALLFSRTSEEIVLTGGWKKPRSRLSPEERTWLTTMVNYAQIVIENLNNTDDLLKELKHTDAGGETLPMTVKRMMVRLSERERWQLAKDLHDHNLQDQLAIARDMDSWRQAAKDPKLRRFLGVIREHVLDSVYTLRQVIYEIHPEFIYQTGLKKSLEELFEKVNLRADFMLHVFIDEHISFFKKEWEMVIYRVVQELLNNAMKHARAKHVRLSLTEETEGYLLFYQDDGVGMDVSGVGQTFGTMGFPGMIGRVEGMGGRISVRSDKGKGMEVQVRWPSYEPSGYPAAAKRG